MSIKIWSVFDLLVQDRAQIAARYLKCLHHSLPHIPLRILHTGLPTYAKNKLRKCPTRPNYCIASWRSRGNLAQYLEEHGCILGILESIDNALFCSLREGTPQQTLCLGTQLGARARWYKYASLSNTQSIGTYCLACAGEVTCSTAPRFGVVAFLELFRGKSEGHAPDRRPPVPLTHVAVYLAFRDDISAPEFPTLIQTPTLR
jgi:hypothetical protein